MTTLTHVKKRTGEIVPFDRKKILLAVMKAFRAETGDVEEIESEEITKAVVSDIETAFRGGEIVPGIEHIQDAVETALMKRGHFRIAKSYILYRAEHAEIRVEEKQEVIRKIEERQLKIVKRSGKEEKFSLDKVRKSLQPLVHGHEKVVDIDVIAEQCQHEIFDGATTKDITKALVMATRALIEKDPAYSIVASRLLLNSIYKEIIGHDNVEWKNFESQYRASFEKSVRTGVRQNRLDPRMLEFNFEKISAAIDPHRDDRFEYLGTQTLADRYLLKDQETKQFLETPQFMWMRVAMGLALNEEKKEDRAIEFYDVVSGFRFTPSTPTLFHSGTQHPQLSSCYLNTVEDDLHHIFKVYSDNAQLSKWSGGIGTDWTNLRATGAYIKGTGVESQGTIPFLKIANDVTVAINRSGKRRGAACVYLEAWHYDIEEFLELRKNTGDERRRTHDMDTANWIPDLFMKRVRDNGEWTLFSPDETPDLHHIYGKKFEEAYIGYEEKAARGEIKLFKKIKARDLWKKMLSMLFETGHPWITFKDPSNIRSPQDHVGVVHNSNLCTEITLNTSAEETAVCNLGSINLAEHVHDGKFDAEMIAKTATTAMRMLDNVVDINFYPTIEAKNSNLKHRPVGLGIMGFQDALYKLDINFESEEAALFADESMEIVSYHVIMASSLLAKERGAYSSYKGSKWDRGIFPVDTLDLLQQERGEPIDVPRSGKLDWTPVREHVKQYGMRNSNTMAIAPTATISNIVGSFPTIEPIYKNIYVKSNQSGDFTVVNSYLIEDLKRLGLWDYEMIGKLKYHDGSIKDIPGIPEVIKNKYKETFEINPFTLVKIAAYRSKWIDQSQSLNIFYKGASGKDLNDAYFYAWSLGLKTTYYLRTLGASQVEKSTVSTTEFGKTHMRGATKETVAAASQPVVAATPAAPVNASLGGLCKIDDPTCESCQ